MPDALNASGNPRGAALLDDPTRNKRIAFTAEERKTHGLEDCGHAGTEEPGGAYEPSSSSGTSRRESPQGGYRSFSEGIEGDKLPVRADSLSSHFGRARQFPILQTKPEQDRMVAAITFELGKVETPLAVARVPGRRANISEGSGGRVAARLGGAGRACAAGRSGADGPQA